jgi:hypothetical protein
MRRLDGCFSKEGEGWLACLEAGIPASSFLGTECWRCGLDAGFGQTRFSAQANSLAVESPRNEENEETAHSISANSPVSRRILDPYADVGGDSEFMMRMISVMNE